MRIVKFLPLAFAGGLLVLAPLPASAQQSAQQQTASNDTVQDGEVNAVNRVVCRRFPPPTGSRIGPRRICKTQHEWDLIRQESREAVDEATSRNLFGNE